MSARYVEYTASAEGYSVCVFDAESTPIDEYHAGNSRLDSQIWIDPLDPDALCVGTIRRFARQEAESTAARYGLDASQIVESVS